MPATYHFLLASLAAARTLPSRLRTNSSAAAAPTPSMGTAVKWRGVRVASCISRMRMPRRWPMSRCHSLFCLEDSGMRSVHSHPSFGRGKSAKIRKGHHRRRIAMGGRSRKLVAWVRRMTAVESVRRL
ncbi:hypothetical protein B0H13DRAFT_413855 [Mycena leptocephala]|nr:hypothetical protein B0H13DRAFT_413855 [Mycena leptocephala]